MDNLRDIFRCNVCGHVIEIINEGIGTLVCCDKPMVKLEARKEDEGKEKHVPVIENAIGGIRVKVGSVEHPMEPKHFIKMIEVLTKDKVLRAELKPGQKPEAFFAVPKEEVLKAREFCTVHMLWGNA